MTKRSSVWFGSLTRRRGAAIAAIVVMMAMLNLVVIGSVQSSSDEAQWAEARVQSERAFHAAEAGLRIIIASVLAGEDPPVEGTVVSVGVSVVEFVEVPEAGQSGEVVLEGRAGSARRRLSVIVQ